MFVFVEEVEVLVGFFGGVVEVDEIIVVFVFVVGCVVFFDLGDLVFF